MCCVGCWRWNTSALVVIFVLSVISSNGCWLIGWCHTPPTQALLAIASGFSTELAERCESVFTKSIYCHVQRLREKWRKQKQESCHYGNVVVDAKRLDIERKNKFRGYFALLGRFSLKNSSNHNFIGCSGRAPIKFHLLFFLSFVCRRTVKPLTFI